MKWIEDILNAKLGNSKADADPSLDDSLWNNIQTGLSEPEVDSGSAAGNSTWLNRAASVGAVFFILGGVGVGLKWESDTVANKDEFLSTQVVENKALVQEINREEENPLGTEQIEQGEAFIASVPDAPMSTEEAIDPMVSTLAPFQSASTRTFRDGNQSQEARAGEDDQEGGDLPGMRFGKNEEIARDAVTTLGDAIENRTTPPLKPLKLRRLARNWPIEAVLNEIDTDTGERSRPRHIAVRAFGGLTLSDFHYTSDELGTFSDYFHAGSAAGAGLAVDFNFRNQRWSVGVGWLDYAQRLEFEHTWQTEFVDPDGLISIEMDPVTGDTLAMETGPVLVTASHLRQFRNYNHVNAVVIPFEWRKEWLIARWTLGGGLGGQLLIRTGASGHSFADEGTLASFNDADLPGARIAWSPFTRIYGGYQFQPEWRLDASVSLGFQSLRSAGSEQLSSPGLKQWDGQLRTLQVAVGLTRFFELSRTNSVQ